MKKYQKEYAAGRPQMYDQRSRLQKADRMVKLVKHHLHTDNLNDLSLLDIGASTGIITNELAKSFGKVTGIDIDESAIKHAQKTFKKKGLEFTHGDAMGLNFKPNSFDVVICAQVYEHVPDSTKLMSEIYRVLKPGGICYFAALNQLWPIEPHYNLPFLAWLPRSLADRYLQLTGKSRHYYESLKTPWELSKLCKKFKITKYTGQIISNPSKFGFENKIPPFITILRPVAEYTMPTLFWILTKED